MTMTHTQSCDDDNDNDDGDGAAGMVGEGGCRLPSMPPYPNV